MINEAEDEWQEVYRTNSKSNKYDQRVYHANRDCWFLRKLASNVRRTRVGACRAAGYKKHC